MWDDNGILYKLVTQLEIQLFNLLDITIVIREDERILNQSWNTMLYSRSKYSCDRCG